METMSRITARYPSGAAYIRVCPGLESEIANSSRLASLILDETLNTLADLEDEEESRGGHCLFCSDFRPGETNLRIKRAGDAAVAYSCKYCPICGRKLREH